MKRFSLLHSHKLSCSSCIFYIAYHCLATTININCDVSALVKFATRSGIVSYVVKVVAPGHWDNIIRNVIFRGREGKSFYDIHKSCHFGCP